MEDPTPPTPPTPPRSKNNRRPAIKDPSRKDLIRIRNRLNNRVYKFACLTCIAGHRAPQCDPVKHHDKVLYRRPDPGRPAKNCGHPASQGCNCKALRKLCCLLDEQQWAELRAGGIPTATMYDDEDELNKAVNEQRIAQEQAQAHEQALQAANLYAYHQHPLPYQPVPPLLDMPFVHPGQMVQHDQHMAYHPVPPPQFDFYGNAFAPAAFQPTEYTPQFQPAAIQPQYQDLTIQADTTALQQFAAHMAQEEQIAAQPSANPTKSCCSSRSQAAQPLMQPASSLFNIPSSFPKAQFGCQNCASFDCTCLTCPELSQSSSGAWSHMCGRGCEFDRPVLPPVLLKQEYSSSSQETQDVFQGIPEYQSPLQDYSQGLPEHQTPLQNYSQQPQDVFHQIEHFTQQSQDAFHQSQDFTLQPQGSFYQAQNFTQQPQGFSQQPQDAFQGLSELQAPLEDYSQLPSLNVPNLPEFQLGQTRPTFDGALGYDDSSDIPARW